MHPSQENICFLIPKSIEKPKMNQKVWFFVLNEAFDFLDGGEVFARVRDFHFASNASNFFGFGLNLNLVNLFKVIQHPKISLNLESYENL